MTDDQNKTHRLQDQMAYPPRAMRAERAAAYLAMSTSKFLQLVAERRMPQPVRIDGVVSWDRFELDAAYDDFVAERDGRNTLDEILMKKENEPLPPRRKSNTGINEAIADAQHRHERTPRGRRKQEST